MPVTQFSRYKRPISPQWPEYILVKIYSHYMVYYTASNPKKKKLTAHITTFVLGAYCFYLVDFACLIWEGALQFKS